MSDLSALQPTIFFASCTLKGLVWLPWYFLPELFLSSSTSTVSSEDVEEDTLPLALQDHHLLLMERLCHYTNIFALFGIVSFYWVNPRWFSYLFYGWFLTALLLVQHIPQLVVHEQWHTKLWLLVSGTGSSAASTARTFDDDMMDDIYAATMETEEPDTDTTTSTTSSLPHPTSLDMLQTNLLFGTLGVLIIQFYALYQGGHLSFLQRLAAEPFMVYLALLTILLETHVVCLSAWYSHYVRQTDNDTDTNSNSEMDNLLGLEEDKEGGVHHISTHFPYLLRQVLCGLLVGGILGAAVFHRRVHAAQAKILRNQLKTVKKKKSTVAAKMKFV